MFRFDFTEGQWGTSACGNILPFICKRENKAVTVINPLPGLPTTGNCPKNYFKLGSKCFILKGVQDNERKNWIDARDDCQKQSGGTLATISNYGEQGGLWRKQLSLHQRHIPEVAGSSAGPNSMALLTVSTESALAEVGNSVLTASIFHGLAENFGFCACVLHVTRHSTLTRLAQKFGACT